jgi:hypothetical protein
MPGFGTGENRYQIELDTIPLIQATEVSGGTLDHTPFELFISNQPNPIIGRANFKIEEVTVKHAFALNGDEQQVFDWIDDYVTGDDVTKIGCRVVVFDEDGMSPVATIQFMQIVPTKWKMENMSSGGNNPAYFSFSFRPTDMQVM